MQDTLAKNLYQMWFAGKVVFLSFLKGNPGSKHMPTSRTSPFLGLSTRLLSQLIPLWDPGTGKTVIILHLGSQNFSVRSSLRVSTVIKIKVPGLIPQQRKKKEQSLAKHCIVPLWQWREGGREKDLQGWREMGVVGSGAVSGSSHVPRSQWWALRGSVGRELYALDSQVLHFPAPHPHLSWPETPSLHRQWLCCHNHSFCHHQRQFCLPGDFQKYLETFVITEGRVLLVSSG